MNNSNRMPMDEKRGYELIQGKGNEVCFDSSCPGCKSLVKELAWIEHNSFLTQIQCPLCGYDKVNEVKLADEGLSGINANIEIKLNLYEMAQNGNIAMQIWLGKHALHQKAD